MQRYAIAAALAATLLAGCATGYNSAAFSEQQVAPDTFRVTFNGNRFTDPRTAQDMQLLRVADVVMAAGFSHFTMTGGVYQAESRTWHDATAYTSIVRGKGGSSIITSYSPGYYSSVHHPRGDTLVKAYRGAPQDTGMVVYSAEAVCREIGPRYDAPCVKAMTPAM